MVDGIILVWDAIEYYIEAIVGSREAIIYVAEANDWSFYAVAVALYGNYCMWEAVEFVADGIKATFDGIYCYADAV